MHFIVQSSNQNSSSKRLLTAHTLLCERRILKSRLAVDLVEWFSYPIINILFGTITTTNNNNLYFSSILLFFFLHENAKQADAPLHARYVLK